MPMTAPTAPIAVGVDGSPSSGAALRKAAQLAAAMDVALLVVTCWTVPQLYYDFIDMDNDAFERDAGDRQGAALAEVFAGHCPVQVQSVLRHGRAATELIAASTQAQLLVLGTRGHGGFVNMILGSVSLECIAHAQCPVVTVRADQPEHDTAARSSTVA